jgi:hypothetical protein
MYIHVSPYQRRQVDYFLAPGISPGWVPAAAGRTFFFSFLLPCNAIISTSYPLSRACGRDAFFPRLKTRDRLTLFTHNPLIDYCVPGRGPSLRPRYEAWPIDD